MNERYRWNEEQDRRRREEEARRRRETRGGPDLTGRDYYGVGSAARPDENRSWEGREPYPQDVGGINHPGDDHHYGLDPLTGDRGSGEQDERYRSGYRGAQYGDEAVPQRDRGYSAGEAARGYRSRGPYAEGGFEPRSYRDDLEREHEARSWWARARDEFRAWMGDREAERRVRHDHQGDERFASHGGDWRGHDDDTGWRDPVHPQQQEHRRRFEQETREHRPGYFRDER
jgi:hypothetical protein